MSNGASRLGYVGAMMVGGACGILAGLLIAPASGQETRRRWMRRLDDEKEDILRRGHRLVERAAHSLEENINEGRLKVSRALER